MVSLKNCLSNLVLYYFYFFTMTLFWYNYSHCSFVGFFILTNLFYFNVFPSNHMLTQFPSNMISFPYYLPETKFSFFNQWLSHDELIFYSKYWIWSSVHDFVKWKWIRNCCGKRRVFRLFRYISGFHARN